MQVWPFKLTRLVFVLSLLYPSWSLEYCRVKRSSWTQQSEVKFSMLLSLRKADNGKCTLISGESLQNYAAAAWVVDKLNTGYPNNSFIPGVKIGFEMLDNCQNSVYAVRNAFEILNPDLSREITECNGTSVLNLGILGTFRSSTSVEVARLLKNSGIPMISPSATAVALSDKSQYPEFLRTALPDTFQVKPILKILKELRWTYVVVVHSDDIYGRAAAALLQNNGKEQGICFVKKLEIFPNERQHFLTELFEVMNSAKENNLGIVYFGQKDSAENLMYYFSKNLLSGNLYWIMSDAVGKNYDVFKQKGNVVAGTLTVSPSSIVLSEFEEFYKNKLTNNTVMRAYVEQNQDISLGDGFKRQNDYVPLTVDAVFAYAVALKNAHAKLCQNTHGICQNLEQVIKTKKFHEYVKAVDVNYSVLPQEFVPREFVDAGRQFTFDLNGDVSRDTNSSLFLINSFNEETQSKFVQVGEYTNAGLALDKTKIKMKKGNTILTGESLPESICKGACLACSNFGQIPMVYSPGDVYILGIFSLHKTDPNNPFKCKDFRSVSSDSVVLEAFLHAVRQLNKSTTIKFGAIAFDDCYSPVRITTILSDFFSGLSQSQVSLFSHHVPQNKTVAVIGALSSGSTIPVAQFFTRLNTPVISYAASTPDLDDRVNFPLFLRTVPSDVEQAQAMVNIIIEMGWEYVGLLYVNNNYGTKGKQKFETLAAERGICIAEPLAVSEQSSDIGNTDLHKTVIKLQQQQTKVVVFFGIDTRFAEFLEVVNAKKHYGRFIILASEEWGTKDKLLKLGKKAARGAITLKLETIDSAYSGFPDYLKSQTLSRHIENPWFREFWQHQFECNIEGGFNNVFNKVCSPGLKLTDANIQKHLQDQRVTHVMNAVYAAGMGIQKSKGDLCRDEKDFPCRFYYDPKYSTKVWQNIRSINFPGERYSMFDGNGNGDIGFLINNVQVKENELKYVEVGSYTRRGLDLQKAKLEFYDELGVKINIQAKCEEGGLCSHCVRQTTPGPLQPTPAAVDSSSLRIADIILIVIVIVLVGLVIFGLVLLLLYLKKKLTGLSKEIQKHAAQTEPIYQAVSEKRVYQNPSSPPRPPRQIQYSRSNDDITFVNGSQESLGERQCLRGTVNPAFHNDNGQSGGLQEHSSGGTVQSRGTISGSVPVSSGGHTTPSNEIDLNFHSSSVSPTNSGYSAGLTAVQYRHLPDLQGHEVANVPNGHIPLQALHVVSDLSHLQQRPTTLNVHQNPRYMDLRQIPPEQLLADEYMMTSSYLGPSNLLLRQQALAMSDPNIHARSIAQSPMSEQKYSGFPVQHMQSPVSDTNPTILSRQTSPVLSEPASVLQSLQSHHNPPSVTELQFLQQLKQHQQHELQQQQQQQQQLLEQQQQQQQQQQQHQQEFQQQTRKPPATPGQYDAESHDILQRLYNARQSPADTEFNPSRPSKLNGSVDSLRSSQRSQGSNRPVIQTPNRNSPDRGVGHIRAISENLDPRISRV